jgi:hypothetical protein
MGETKKLSNLQNLILGCSHIFPRKQRKQSKITCSNIHIMTSLNNLLIIIMIIIK